MSDYNNHAAARPAPPRGEAELRAIEHTPWRQRTGARTTYDVLRQACARHPEHIALRSIATGEADAPETTVSYQHLLERVTQAANAFHRAGIAPGRAVALLLPNLPETHYALWGAQAAGIANPINPLLDVEHIAAIIDATQAEALVALAPAPGSHTWAKAMAVAASVSSHLPPRWRGKTAAHWRPAATSIRPMCAHISTRAAPPACQRWRCTPMKTKRSWRPCWRCCSPIHTWCCAACRCSTSMAPW